MKKVFLTIGILALLVGCGKSEGMNTRESFDDNSETAELSKDDSWKTKAYKDYINIDMVYKDMVESDSNKEFFFNNTNLFPYSVSEYGKYLDKEISLEKYIKDFEGIKSTLIRKEFVVERARTISDDTNKRYQTIIESYDIEKSIGVNVLVLGKEDSKVEALDTVEVTGLPCALYTGFKGTKDSVLEKNNTPLNNVLFIVATNYRIVDKGGKT